MVQAMARGILRKRQQAPVPGDFVRLADSGDPDVPYVISSIYPRRNLLLRPPASNIDQLLIVASASQPRIHWHFIDLLVLLAKEQAIVPLLILNKCDEQEPAQVQQFMADYVPTGLRIFSQGLGEEEELARLKQALEGRTSLLAGQSGVGKSSLLNRLQGEAVHEVGALGCKGERRGRQTTRSIRFVPFAGGLIADTPGFEVLDVSRMALELSSLMQGYPELLAIQGQCRFADCKHLGELGCAVEKTPMSPARLQRYRSFREDYEALPAHERMP